MDAAVEAFEAAKQMRRVQMGVTTSDHSPPRYSTYDYAGFEEQKAAVVEALWRGICRDPARIEEFLNDGR